MGSDEVRFGLCRVGSASAGPSVPVRVGSGRARRRYRMCGNPDRQDFVRVVPYRCRPWVYIADSAPFAVAAPASSPWHGVA